MSKFKRGDILIYINEEYRGIYKVIDHSDEILYCKPLNQYAWGLWLLPMYCTKIENLTDFEKIYWGANETA